MNGVYFKLITDTMRVENMKTVEKGLKTSDALNPYRNENGTEGPFVIKQMGGDDGLYKVV